ncbi:ABC transporter G family member 8 [Gossypium arboreum]|uniref:ABC transporter G family member 8 n=1 Tax=Gossypium arboreum TaxID=29729 RepID=A0A0B0NW18_GOSAR|nr:ABC transporter G family member 8 [Gossypium arboreum]
MVHMGQWPGHVNRESLGRHPRKTRACELPVWQGLGHVILWIWSILSLFGSFLAPFALLCSPKCKT